MTKRVRRALRALTTFGRRFFRFIILPPRGLKGMGRDRRTAAGGTLVKALSIVGDVSLQKVAGKD
jgi:hypothetical protein